MPLDEKAEHSLPGLIEEGFLPAEENGNGECFEKINGKIDMEEAILEDFIDNSSMDGQEIKGEKQKMEGNKGGQTSTSPIAEFLWITSDSFISSYGSQNFLSFLGRDKRDAGANSFDGKSSDKNFKLPRINTWNVNKIKKNKKALSPVEEILPPMEGKRIYSVRKNTLPCSPLMNAPLSLPLLKDSGVVNVLSACDSKFGSPISEPVSPNSPELKRYSDGWTTADRREINSLHWLAKRRQSSRALRKKYEGLLPRIEKPVNKRY